MQFLFNLDMMFRGGIIYRTAWRNDLGELFALITAFLWASTATMFAIGTQLANPRVVNRLRLAVATLLLVVTHLVLEGSLIPADAGSDRWLWLGISGIIGLVIGDGMLLIAFEKIGARIALLIFATVPMISVILAWAFLGEALALAQIIAIVITMAGIGFVVSEVSDGQGGGDVVSRSDFRWGLLLAFGGALGQAIALVSAKKGMEGGFSPLSGVVLRMIIATMSIWLLTLFRGEIKSTFVYMHERKFVKVLLIGTVVGPYLGIWASLVALELTNVGIASTLMALSPIILLPIDRIFFKKAISRRSVIGTLVAMLGVALLFII